MERLFFLGLLLGNYLYYNRVITRQPDEIKSLKAQIEEKNKQLLAAQILAEKREGVTQLIKSNLISSPSDSLAEKASVPFLRYLTSKMDQLDIRLVSVTPLEVIGTTDPNTQTVKEFIEVPYELKILASYDELGKFLDDLEKSPLRSSSVGMVKLLIEFGRWFGRISMVKKKNSFCLSVLNFPGQ